MAAEVGRPRVVIAAVALIVAAGVAIGFGKSGEASDGDRLATAVAVVDCETRDQIIPPRRHPGRISRAARRVSVRAGPLYFLGAKQWGNTRFKPRQEGLHPTKVPFLLKANRAVTVSVFPPPGRRAIVSVGNAEGPPPWVVRGPSVELRSCPPSAEVAGRRVGKRTPFTAGFRIDGRICLRVEVEVEGRQEPIRRRISFGKGRRCTARPIVITQDEGTSRPNCHPRQMGRRLQNISVALRTIDAKVLRRQWKWHGFVFFGVSGAIKHDFGASTHREGMRKLRRRKGRLRLRFDEVEVRGPGGQFEGVFTTKGSRERPFHGKWAWRCRRPGLIRMPVLVTRRPIDQVQCPPPSEPAPKRAMIVCTRAE